MATAGDISFFQGETWNPIWTYGASGNPISPYSISGQIADLQIRTVPNGSLIQRCNTQSGNFATTNGSGNLSPLLTSAQTVVTSGGVYQWQMTLTDMSGRVSYFPIGTCTVNIPVDRSGGA